MLPKISAFRTCAALLSLATALLLQTHAEADVTLSSAATQNISCSNGVCAPTATNAVLNVGDLETMLASGNVEVTTTGSGVQTNNINVTSGFTWSAANALTLDAYDSIAINRAVTVSGTGGLSIMTNDGGSDGSLFFGPKGHIVFRNLSSPLAINGTAYTLFNELGTLAYAMATNPDGSYAFASDYDAGPNGAYSGAPLYTTFDGNFDGLGNTIKNLTITQDEVRGPPVGLFTETYSGATVSHLNLYNENVNVINISDGVGGLVGWNNGATLRQIHVTGSVTSKSLHKRYDDAAVGAIVGENYYGYISASFADVTVVGKSDAQAGGLVGLLQGGTIVDSYALGDVRSQAAGGLVGYVDGSEGAANIIDSYSTGKVTQANGTSGGGFIGYDQDGEITTCYWDTTTSGTDNGVGDGNVSGLTGLTSRRLRSGLPAGFDPTVWAENRKINNGFPYLIANPPPGN